MENRTCSPSCSMSLLFAALLLAVTWTMGVDAEREGEGVERCGEGRTVGDKWFDGCQWCVCTHNQPRCSSSACSSLVRQVPTCHVPGQTWTDGCYQCRCRRQGITCRLDVTCRLLRQRPVPCLADERCVCGPDGVPSCTAEVIDRKAFVARRIRLGFPHVLGSRRGRQDSHRGRHNGHRGHRGHRGRVTRGRPEGRQFLLSRQRRSVLPLAQDYLPLHRSHPHGQEDFEAGRDSSLPFSKVNGQQGSRSADESAQELLITSDNLCRFGARWYGGSLRCFCDEDGAIACGNPVFVLAFFDDFRVEAEQCEEGHAWQDGCVVCTCQMNGLLFCRHDQRCGDHSLFHHGGQDNGGDHYLQGIVDQLSEESGDVMLPSTLSPHRKKGVTAPGAGCMPGSQWREGCLHCRCTRHGRQLCSSRYCGPHDDVDTPVSSNDDDEVLESLVAGNHANEVPAIMGSAFKRSRRPMLVAPKPVGGFRVPAYAGGSGLPLAVSPCGRFRVGHKYWDDCNLCLCTSRGPRCQGKLCY